MFDYKASELENALTGYFISVEPLRLREFPSKQKRKYLVLLHIVKAFEASKKYTEEEVNDILFNIYPDFATLRRALVDYKFLERTKDCKQYWLIYE